MKTALLAVPALALSLLLGACSGEEQDATLPREEATTTAPAADEGVISPAGMEVAPEFDNQAQGVIDDVRVEECDTEPGDVTASGTATNSGRFARDVVVVMSWTVGSTGDVVGRGVATLEDLEPGESADWTIETTLAGSTTAACVPSAQAGQLKD